MEYPCFTSVARRQGEGTTQILVSKHFCKSQVLFYYLGDVILVNNIYHNSYHIRYCLSIFLMIAEIGFVIK